MDLVCSIEKGERVLSYDEQIEQIMELHTEQLFRIAYYYTKDLQIAEVIVQDVFIKFYHH